MIDIGHLLWARAEIDRLRKALEAIVAVWKNPEGDPTLERDHMYAIAESTLAKPNG